MKLPHSEWRQPFFYIAQSPIIEYISLACIIVNTVIMILEWVNQPEELDRIFEMLNIACAAIFSIEFAIKYIGYGNRYFQDGWNTFDMIIVVLTLLSMILSAGTSLKLGS